MSTRQRSDICGAANFRLFDHLVGAYFAKHGCSVRLPSSLYSNQCNRTILASLRESRHAGQGRTQIKARPQAPAVLVSR